MVPLIKRSYLNFDDNLILNIKILIAFEKVQFLFRGSNYIFPQFFLLFDPKSRSVLRGIGGDPTKQRAGRVSRKAEGPRKDPQSRYISSFSNARYREAAEDNGKERSRVTKNPDKGSLLRERHLENTGNHRYFRECHDPN